MDFLNPTSNKRSYECINDAIIGRNGNKIKDYLEELNKRGIKFVGPKEDLIISASEIHYKAYCHILKQMVQNVFGMRHQSRIS